MILATTKERIIELIERKNISKALFFKETGIKRGLLDADKLKSTVTDVVVAKIIATYSDINPIWLITGEGKMLLNEEEKGSNNISPSVSPESEVGVPYYDVDFSGGFNAIFNNQTLLPDHNIVFAPFKDAQLWCNVTGNSMAEKINHGDIIAIKELTDWEENILFGEIYAVVTNHLRTIKIIRKSNNENNYRLVPINTNEFDENEVKKTSILKVFTVLGAIKKFF
ncbi:helix-turn-helix transcriptional regulator [Ancylomarina sp.]|uniref:S24 family peptidase n=1 Tax=Ancylomarina sp. TaxID=1970196 RepID=UPI0035668A45